MKLGFKNLAKILVHQTFKGSIQMLENNKTNAAEFKSSCYQRWNHRGRIKNHEKIIYKNFL